MTAPPGASPFWRSFGPGLLWAAAAIGVSHLVQSTRAGADAGFGLAGVILLALVLKYPFFEFGPRYAAATGSSLVEGYARIGRWALWLYVLITLATAVIVQTAVIIFTAVLVRYTLGLTWPLSAVAAALIGACALLLRRGHFRALDATIKAVLVLLALSTLWAALLILPRADVSTLALVPDPTAWRGARFAFALAGWMPSAIDIAVWSSLWTLAKDRTTGTRASVRTARLDFVIGYVGTGVLAFAFVTLGAGVMYRSGESFEPAGAMFATQLVELYARTLGAWMRPVVLLAVLTTMLSTALTVVDGFPRAIERSLARLRVRDPDADVPTEGPYYWGSIAVLGLLTVLILALFAGTLTAMVDFATIVSFLTAPVLGYLNLRAVTAREVAPAHRPGRAMLLLSQVGLVLLGGTAIVYLVSLLA